MPVLMFFPWLELNEKIDLEELKLLPYSRQSNTPELGTQKKTIDNLLECYIDKRQKPIENAVLLVLKSHKVIDDFEHEEILNAYELAEILAFCGIAEREYFTYPFLYTNRDNFLLQVRQFSDSSTASTITTYRRDGVTQHITSKSVLRFTIPNHVNVPFRLRLNVSLLQAVLKAKVTLSGKEWRHLKEAIFFYNMANTDNYEATIREFELLFLVGAIQQLLDVKSKVHSLRTEFLKVFKPLRNVVPKLRNPYYKEKGVGKGEPEKCVARNWIEDIYNLRHKPAHGKLSGHESKWKLQDHLLLSTYIFPLLLKRILEGKQIYVWTEEDQFNEDAFEELAYIPTLFPENLRKNKEHPWDKIRNKMRWEKLMRDLN